MKQPNIVFIMADDMGYGDLSCYNAESRIPTPNMDALADQGMRFTDAHSPSAVCTPTRYGVLTGRYCWRTRLKRGVLGGYDAPLIETSRLTVASMLKHKGYNTACIGKWHVGLTFQDSHGDPVQDDEKRVDFSKPILGGPSDLGFDYAYYNAACGTGSSPYGFIENDRFVDDEFSHYDSTVEPFETGGGMMGKSWVTKDADVIIARKACEYIEDRSKDEAPFFLYLTPNAPHEPCAEPVVPDFARGKSEAGSRGDLVWLFDWIVGQVMETLERTSQAENTLIMVTSDNGALPGDFVFNDEGVRVEANPDRREFEYRTYGHKSCGDFRGYKAHIWDGGHREPLIARWPGTIQCGTISDEVVCLTDLMATCAAIVGIELPDNAAEDSYDISPVFRDDELEQPLREATVHHSSHGVFSIRQGCWKLIQDTKTSGGWPTPRGERPVPGTPGQLYDIMKDPAEQNDLWEREPQVVARLSGLLNGYIDTGRSATYRGSRH